MYFTLKLKQEEEFRKKKKKTAFWVILSHVIVLVVVFVVFTCKGCSNPKEQVISVSLISQAEYTKTVQDQSQKKASEPSKQYKPKKNIRKVPEEKKWKALDPSQIKKSNTQVIKKNYTPQKNYTPVNASDIATNIRQNISNIKFNSSFSTSTSTLQYYDKISAYLYNKWKQPSRAAVGSGIPVVNVIISVDSEGKVINSYIKKRSGINAMDSSVSSLLSNLTYLPRPPDGAMKIDVYLELSN